MKQVSFSQSVEPWPRIVVSILVAIAIVGATQQLRAKDREPGASSVAPVSQSFKVQHLDLKEAVSVLMARQTRVKRRHDDRASPPSTRMPQASMWDLQIGVR